MLKLVKIEPRYNEQISRNTVCNNILELLGKKQTETNYLAFVIDEDGIRPDKH